MKGLGINTAIVKVLKEYNEDVSIDFLAKVIGRDVSETQSNLLGLKEEGVIEFSEENKVHIKK